MTNSLKILSLSLSMLLLPLSAEAHRVWLLPNSTIISSGTDAWVSVDAAASNDIFHADHAPMPVNYVEVVGPDNKTIPLHNIYSGKFRSSFEFPLVNKGTYKVAMAANGIMATWETASGEHKMWPYRGAKADPAEFDKAVPKQAKNLEVSEFYRRVETYVTSGAPDTQVFKPSKTGLELVPVTHPNDLYVGEAARFRFLMNGKAAAGIQVSVIPDAMRYRSDQGEIQLTSDSNGEVSITWPRAGMFWLSAEYQDNKAKKPASIRVASYALTLEVFPAL